MTTQSIHLAWGAKVSTAFALRVIQMGKDFQFDPNWLMACMAFETGRTFSPSVKNLHSTATGLIQFMRATAEQYGVTTAELAEMTAEKQFDYVWLYFRDIIKARGPVKSLGDCYMVILNPSGVGKADDFSLWVKGSSAFAANAGLDANQDHKITKAEAAAHVSAMLIEGMGPINAADITVADTSAQPQPKETTVSFLSKFVFNPILAEIARGFSSSSATTQATATAANDAVVPVVQASAGSSNSPLGNANSCIAQLENDLNSAVAAFVQATIAADVPVIGALIAPRAGELTKIALTFAENHALTYVAALFHFHKTSAAAVTVSDGV